jgi:hypothetical protein
VVLLDGIEMAHPDVFNILLQVLDDGRLTDGQGRTVNFSNAVLIMTSNLPGDPADFFKPEFLNRIDEVIRFRALTRADMAAIVDIQLDHLRGRLAERRLVLEVTADAELWLANTGYDQTYGARPLKRLIQREIGDRVALPLLDGRYGEHNSVVKVDADDGHLVLCCGVQGLSPPLSAGRIAVARSGPPCRRRPDDVELGRGPQPVLNQSSARPSRSTTPWHEAGQSTRSAPLGSEPLLVPEPC